MDTVSSWSTSHLLAELARRQEGDGAGAIADKPVCSSGEKGSYNTSAHVYALVLILILSTVCMSCSLGSLRLLPSNNIFPGSLRIPLSLPPVLEI